MRQKPLRGRHSQRLWYIERVAELCEMYETCPIVAEGFGIDSMHKHDMLRGNNVWRKERRQGMEFVETIGYHPVKEPVCRTNVWPQGAGNDPVSFWRTILWMYNHMWQNGCAYMWVKGCIKLI